jgi:hypothetical protein
MSRAVRLLQDAPVTRCGACGRMTATTSDGACADCWARKLRPALPAGESGPGGLPTVRSLLRSLVSRRR